MPLARSRPARRRARHARALAVALLAASLPPSLAACGDGASGEGASAAGAGPATEPALRPPPPPERVIADSALLASVRRGRAIASATRDSLPAHVGNALRCTSCHLDDGTRPGALPWIGVYARFPQYRAREGRVIRLEDRVNACLRRSLAGRALPHADPAMRDVVAYLAYLSYGVPVGASAPPRAELPRSRGDTVSGRIVYAGTCARCHGGDGAGGSAPPLWGPRSFTIGAGMARERTAAAFIHANMPHDRPGTLAAQAAADVAAFVTSRPRPDFQGKEHDWPHGGAPRDAAYATLAARRGHGRR